MMAITLQFILKEGWVFFVIALSGIIDVSMMEIVIFYLAVHYMCLAKILAPDIM